jgi:hypothetical protein
MAAKPEKPKDAPPPPELKEIVETILRAPPKPKSPKPRDARSA